MGNKPLLHLAWSFEGLREALDNENIVVVVDVLRFSSAVVTAIANGFIIYPASDYKKGTDLATSIGAELSGRPDEARYSISPSSFMNATGDDKEVILPSPNGSTCAELIREDEIGYIGCLLNAKAVGRHVSQIAFDKKKDVTVIAAGEQKAIDTGERIVYDLKSSYRVFAIEDYLGAGAIICYSVLNKSRAARACERAFKRSRDRLEKLLHISFSGKYLIQHNLKKDIEHAIQLNRYDVVPVVRAGRIERL
jgi:2-phosphosulfolactate phosphatase